MIEERMSPRAYHEEFRVEAHKPVGLRGYDARALSLELVVPNDGVSPVQQHEAEKVDINFIVRRFATTGDAPMTRREGLYGDFSGITDYESALRKVTEAREAFMQLPADLRERFQNDPGELLRRLDELERVEESTERVVAGGASVEPVA